MEYATGRIPDRASPAATEIKFASLTPMLKKRPGQASTNRSKSLYPRSAVRRTIRPSDRPASDRPAKNVSRISVPKLFQRSFEIGRARRAVVPLEVPFHEGYAFPLDRVRHDRARSAGGPVPESRHEFLRVVAVDLDGIPAERLPLFAEGFKARNPAAVAGCLELVEVDDRHEVPEVVRGGPQRRLPHRALVALSVGEDDVHVELVALQPSAERDADAQSESVPEGTRGHLHTRHFPTRRVLRERRPRRAV